MLSPCICPVPFGVTLSISPLRDTHAGFLICSTLHVHCAAVRHMEDINPLNRWIKDQWLTLRRLSGWSCCGDSHSVTSMNQRAVTTLDAAVRLLAARLQAADGSGVLRWSDVCPPLTSHPRLIQQFNLSVVVTSFIPSLTHCR